MKESRFCFNSKAFAYIHPPPDESNQYEVITTDDCDGERFIERRNRQPDGSTRIRKYPVDACSVHAFESPNNDEYFSLFDDAFVKISALSIDVGLNLSVWVLGRHNFGNREYFVNSKCCGDDHYMSFLGRSVNHIYNSLNELLTSVKDHLRLSYEVKLRCFEVFADQVRDLMTVDLREGDDKKIDPPKIREHPAKGCYVQGLVEVVCGSSQEAMTVLGQAYSRRLALSVYASEDGCNSTAPRTLGYVGNVFVQLDIEQILSPISAGEGSDVEREVIRRYSAVQYNVLADAEALSFKPSKLETIDISPAMNATVPGRDKKITFLRQSISSVSADGGQGGMVSLLATAARSLTTLSRVVDVLYRNRTGESSMSDADPDPISTLPVKISSGAHIPYRDSSLTRILQPSLEGARGNFLCLGMDMRSSSSVAISSALRLMAELRGGVISTLSSNDKRVVLSEAECTTLVCNLSSKYQCMDHISSGGGSGVSKKALSRQGSLATAVLGAYVSSSVDKSMSNLDSGRELRTCDSDTSSTMSGIFDPSDSPSQVNRKSLVYSAFDVGTTSMRQVASEQARSTATILPADAHKTRPSDFWSLLKSYESDIIHSLDLESLEKLQIERERILSSLDVKPLLDTHSLKDSVNCVKGTGTEAAQGFVVGVCGPTPPSPPVSSRTMVPTGERYIDLLQSEVPTGKGCALPKIDSVSSPGKSQQYTSGTLYSRDNWSRTPSIGEGSENMESLDESKSAAVEHTYNRSVGVLNTGGSRVCVDCHVGTAEALAVSSQPDDESKELGERYHNVTTPHSLTPEKPRSQMRLPHIDKIASSINAASLSYRFPVQAASPSSSVMISSTHSPQLKSSPLSSDLSQSIAGADCSGINSSLADAAYNEPSLSKFSSKLRHSAEIPSVTRVTTSQHRQRASESDAITPSRSTGRNAVTVQSLLLDPIDISPHKMKNRESQLMNYTNHRVRSSHGGHGGGRVRAIGSRSSSPQGSPPAPSREGSLSSSPTGRKNIAIKIPLPSSTSTVEESEDVSGDNLSELELRFLRAASHSSVFQVQRCIAEGVNVNVKNAFGRDAMQIAARNGALDLMKLLFDNGGSVSTRGKKGDTLFHLAASNGHISVMEWMSSVGVLSTGVDLRGQTCVHVAARRGEVDVLRYLHETLHMDLNQEDFDGKTPLQYVPKQALQGNSEEVEETRLYLISVLEINENSSC
mmetsp:Transcript_20920/g.30132  ORF Transcript_20920/g.30132 Transcript_20920/m.30132 type:complete len:1207 (+) Transcript_20920:147-3767(+)|eukprot:CAMPEP_0185040676 /NCGR_PEP_ID=MMETSP1103-20130426/38999_1 /TAXON_ID=36769 /ORGANISM="Paraphysomonas bandaiensis, Strain Caron Lab Isolate" /LENGTH=1206 /DNA_ID=CAMNT_0027580065 /DNA_START=57 /DNA_END=3677 /DNA_ORIENTATION=-